MARPAAAAASAREHMQRALEKTANIGTLPNQSARYAPVQPAPPAQPATRSPIDHAAIRAAAARLEQGKTQSLADVKNMLSSAFNRQ